MTERFVLRNQLPEVESFQRRLEALLRGYAFSDDLIHDLSLISEEMLVNIVHYGYPESEAGEREIKVVLAIDEARRICLEIRDDAIPFNPLAAEERDIDDDRLGGWGIPMLKTLTDHVEYARVGSENVLTLERSERDS